MSKKERNVLMVDFKKLIGEKIANATQLDIEEIINYIES